MLFILSMKYSLLYYLDHSDLDYRNIRKKLNNRFILLRVDIDALKLTENKNLEFKS